MKVFVLESLLNYEGSIILGVYSTEEKAETERDRPEVQKRYDYADDFEISKFVLDAPTEINPSH